MSSSALPASPASSPSGRAAGTPRAAVILEDVVVARTAVAKLCTSLDPAALATAASMVQGDTASSRRAILMALAAKADAALPRVLQSLQVHCQRLQAEEDTTGDTRLPASADALAFAAAPTLLTALVLELHPSVLAAWQVQGPTLLAAADALLAALEAPATVSSHAAAAGTAVVQRQLQFVRGAAAAVVSEQHGTVASLVQELADSLPRLAAEPPADELDAHAGAQAVPWLDALALFRCETLQRQVAVPDDSRLALRHVPCRDAQRLGQCQLRLHLLCLQLWTPGEQGRAAAAAADGAGGVSVLAQALSVGAQLVAASAADDQWQAVGASISPGASAAHRAQALHFMHAVATTASCLLQHMRG